MTYSPKQAKALAQRIDDADNGDTDFLPYDVEKALKLEILALTDPERVQQLKDRLDAEWEKVHWVRETSDDQDLAYLIAKCGGVEYAVREARRRTRLMDGCDF